MTSSNKKKLHPVWIVGLSFVAVMVAGMGFWVLWTLYEQPDNSRMAIQSHEIKAKPAVRVAAVKKKEVIAPSKKVVFVSKIRNTESVSVRCGAVQESDRKAVKIAVAKNESCTVMAVDTQQARYIAYVEKIDAKRYHCFVNGKPKCKKHVQNREAAQKKNTAKEIISDTKKKPKSSVEQVTKSTEPGYISISADVSAKVFLDGHFIGNAPIYKHRAKLGKHRAYIAHPDGRVRRFTISLAAGQQRVYKWSFAESKWLLNR